MSILSTLMVLGVGFVILNSTAKNGYPNTPDSELASKMARTKERGISVLIFHKTGCIDCKRAQKQVVKSLKTGKSNYPKVNYVVLDYKDKQTHKYFKEFNITETPTFVEVKHREVTRLYSGTNAEKISSVIELDWSDWRKLYGEGK